MRLLLIDENPDDRALIVQALQREFAGLHIEQIDDEVGFARALERGEFDLVSTEYRLHWSNGLAVLCAVKARYPDCPVIMLTGSGNEEIATEAMKHGLDEYVVKSPQHIVRLPSVMHAALHRAETARQRRKAEGIATSEHTLRAVIESAPDGIIIMDSAGRMTLVNKQAEYLFGYSRAELLGQLLETLVPERFRDAHARHRTAYLADPKIRPMGRGLELISRRKDGSEFPAEISLSPLQTEEGLQVIAIIRDVTPRKWIEAELEAKREQLGGMAYQLGQVSKLATMGELAANIAHELNNPLTTVSLRVESLLKQTADDPAKRHALEVMANEVERMGALVSNLLQFSRRHVPRISTIDIHEEIANSLALIEYRLRTHGVAVRREFAAEVPMIQADRWQLRQLFLNVLANASDAMPSGGLVTIRTTAGSLPGGRPAVTMTFTDTGIGITAEDLPKIMDPFYTTKSEGAGTGLGLPICRRIVQEHHGTLDITSRIGVGTTVHILLPVSNGTNATSLEQE